MDVLVPWQAGSSVTGVASPQQRDQGIATRAAEAGCQAVVEGIMGIAAKILIPRVKLHRHGRTIILLLLIRVL